MTHFFMCGMAGLVFINFWGAVCGKNPTRTMEHAKSKFSASRVKLVVD